ncbi:MAG: TetR/AcrR family transcriptional regulator [Thermoanaerobaculia bacterium]
MVHISTVRTTGLRDRKRQRTFAAIFTATRDLIASRGFEATTMEAIAARAEVSVGTLYNYFDSKRSLLLALLADATDRVAAQADALIDDPGHDARDAILRLMHLYAESLSRLDRKLLRHAMAMSFTASGPVTKAMWRLDETLIERTQALIGRLQEHRLITADISADTAALTLYGCFTTAMLFWIVQPKSGTGVLRRTLDQQLAVIFKGLLPRARERRR